MYLRKRIRHETLQKLELLKKLKEFTQTREKEQLKIEMKADASTQCDLMTLS